MQVNTMRCRECRGEMTLQVLDAIDGEEHGVRMRIEGMPTMQCPNGHRRLVTPEFAMKMMEQLLADEKLVPIETAEKKGLFRKRFCCPACGQELGDDAGDRVVARRVLDMEGLDAFSVELELPKYRCASCGRESTEPQDTIADDLRKASVHAFHSAAVAPA